MTDLFSRHCPDEAATISLARLLAPVLTTGDVVLLQGTLGAGKSAFSRALIRHIAGNPEEEVPSPTFTLVQVYDHLERPVWHFDLYRLSEPDEVIELGWDDARESAVLLIEWPDRLEDLRPVDALEIRIDLDQDTGADARNFVFSATEPAWESRLQALTERKSGS